MDYALFNDTVSTTADIYLTFNDEAKGEKPHKISGHMISTSVAWQMQTSSFTLKLQVLVENMHIRIF